MNAKQLWQAALERVRAHVSSASFTTWFKATVGCEMQSGALTVAVPNGFACEHLRQRFHDLAASAVREVAGRPLEVRFVVRGPERHTDAQEPAQEPGARMEHAPAPTLGRGRTGERRERLAARDLPRAPLSRVSRQRAVLRAAQPRLLPVELPASLTSPALGHEMRATAAASAVRAETWAAPTEHHAPDGAERDVEPPETTHAGVSGQYRFETFVVGTANRLAYVAATQVAAEPGASYNPLFIYGGTGLGKTHLLLAVAHAARAAGLRVCYVGAERFANELIEAIRHQRTEEFRARYRAVDVLLVDDVQFVAGKASTEEELFHTFNALHDAGRQIVLSSDRTPRAMRQLHDRLRSRFEWGLLADVQPPDVALRLDILRAKARALALAMPDETLAALAALDLASVREMEGALNRVLAYARMLGQPPGPEMVERAVAPLRLERGYEVTGASVAALVADHFGVSMEALRGKGRDHVVAWARQVAMYLLREETDASLGQIGQELGGRDHTTVMHGCARVAQAMATSGATRREVDELRGALRRG